MRTVAADLEEETVTAPAERKTDPVGKEKPADAPEKQNAKKDVKSKKPETAKPVTEHKTAAANGVAPEKQTGDGKPVVVPFETVRKVKAEDAASGKQAAEAKPAEVSKAEKKAAEESKLELSKEEGAMDSKEEVLERKAAVKDEKPSAVEGQMSVLDRLRVQRETKPEASSEKPSPATMHDVADAIAAASGRDASAEPVDEPEEFHEIDRDGVDDEIDAPPFHEDPKGWRQSVVRSVQETRDELKRAHNNMSRVRRSMSDADKRKREKNAKIDASLVRAETLLAEIRDAWR